MPTVGRTLAAERARQGLDLEAASAVTKITTRALKSIEADDFEQLPGTIFARSFVRQYAQFLKLDPAGIVEQFDREQAVDEPQVPTVPEEKRFQVPRMPGSKLDRRIDRNLVSAFVTLVVTVVVCVAALYAYQYWRGHRAVRVPTAAVQSATRPAAIKREATPPPLLAPASVAAAQLNSQQAADGTGGVHALITAKTSCWTRITADGRVVFEGVLNAGESRLVNAATVVNLRAGNAGGLAVKLNGNDVPPLGPEGQVRTVSLTSAGARVIAPTPEVSEPR